MFDCVAFGKGVKYFRIKHGYSQEELSEMANVGSSHFNRVENGRTKPSLALIIKICNILNVSINDCIHYKDDSGEILLKQFHSLIKQFTDEEKNFFAEVLDEIRLL